MNTKYLKRLWEEFVTSDERFVAVVIAGAVLICVWIYVEALIAFFERVF